MSDARFPGAQPFDAQPHEALIRGLASGLRRVRPLRPPPVRAAMWSAWVAALALALLPAADLGAVLARLGGAADMWLQVAGAALTALLAAVAAFETSVPGRSRWWPLLPAPAVLLWLGAGGAGCLRAWAAPAAHDPSLAEERVCLLFILGVSAPLSLLLGLMLRRACPLRPALTAGLAGLAAAGAAAALLTLFHPYDAALTDLLVHAGAVALVVGANQLLAGPALRRGAVPAAVPAAVDAGRGG